MEKNNDKQKWLAFFSIIVCLACILIGGSYYVTSVRSNLLELSVSNVMKVTQQQQQAFDNFIYRDRERIHSYAMEFALCNSDDVEFINNKINLFLDITPAYSVIDLERGISYNNKTGNEFHLSPEELQVYSKFSGSGVRDPYMDLYSADEKFGYYECFEFADGVRGLIQKGYDSSEISEDFSLSFYDDQGFAYIVNRQGDVLLRSAEDPGITAADNIFDMIDSTNGNQTELDSFISALEKEEAGTAFFDNQEEEYVYTYVPIENVDEWYFVSIVPKTAIMDEADRIINNSQALMVICLGALVIILITITSIWRSQKNIKKKDLEIEYQEELFDIFSTYLSKNTDDVYMMFGKKNQQIEYISPNAKRVFGVSSVDDMRRVLDLEYVENGGGKVDIYTEMERLKPGDALDSIETKWMNPETGKQRWFRGKIYGVSIQDEEKIVVYISDRTEEQEIQNTLTSALDAAQIANKAKSSFLSSISHDIRTPMNAIMGLVVLLQEEADNPQYVREYAQKIDAASYHLLGLINDVLDMNKIESGNTTLNISEVSMAEIIDELNMIIRPQTRAKGQEFIINTSPFSCEHLLGDKVRINQILINVLSNAVKYTGEGGRIELIVRELPGYLDKYSRIEFKVRDNGQGMSEDYQEIIFSPFTREHDTGTNKVQGTGLGMAITKSLVELMGGTIKLWSKLGEGSEFTIELELRKQKKEVDLKFWKACGVTRMLVADDEVDVCENVVHAMSETSVEVDYVTDGEKVIDTISRARGDGKPYDVLLLDWKMPKVSGLQVARIVRKNYSSKIPIFLFSAYDWADIEQEAMEIGIDHFLPKPFFMSSFMMAIEKNINSKDTQKNNSLKETSSIVKDRHVLIVEDIEVNRLIMGKLLTARGAVCDIAENGKIAVDIFEESKPKQYDLILMDVQMPVMNGYEATRAIRKSSHPDAAVVPIIAMTANAFADDVRDALNAGMDAHVSKPVVLDKLEAAITEVFNKKNM